MLLTLPADEPIHVMLNRRKTKKQATLNIGTHT